MATTPSAKRTEYKQLVEEVLTPLFIKQGHIKEEDLDVHGVPQLKERKEAREKNHKVKVLVLALAYTCTQNTYTRARIIVGHQDIPSKLAFLPPES